MDKSVTLLLRDPFSLFICFTTSAGPPTYLVVLCVSAGIFSPLQSATLPLDAATQETYKALVVNVVSVLNKQGKMTCNVKGVAHSEKNLA